MGKRGPEAEFVVWLSGDERADLENVIHTGRDAACRLLKARILLKADMSQEGDGWSDVQIAEALDTSPSTVCGREVVCGVIAQDTGPTACAHL